MPIRSTICQVLLSIWVGLSAEDVATLPIGDPARSGRQVAVAIDRIVDTNSGKSLAPAELAAALDGIRLVLVGESHTDLAYHHVQLQVLRELQKRGRTVLVGLEMFPTSAQPALDRWNDGKLSEPAFLEDSRWYLNWGYNWAYYRDIFLYARDHGIRIHGVNTPRAVVEAVRRKGFKDLTPEEAASIPAKIDTASAEHRRLVKAMFSDDEGRMHTMSEQVFDGMFSAQCTWDATMGFNAVRVLQRSGGPKDIMVVLVGQGHVAYGLGIQRQARNWFDGRVASVIPVHVEDLKGRATATVQASYADFLWGLAREEEPLFPSAGMSSRGGRDGKPMTVIDVPKESPAAAAGLKVGDVLASLDGEPLKDLETYHRMMADKRWGDTAVFGILRETQPATVVVHLRRTPPKPREAAAKKP